jgi:hypothetical protein
MGRVDELGRGSGRSHQPEDDRRARFGAVVPIAVVGRTTLPTSRSDAVPLALPNRRGVGTLDTHTHLFEDARHVRDIRTRMAASAFAGLLEPTAAAPGATVLKLR